VHTCEDGETARSAAASEVKQQQRKVSEIVHRAHGQRTRQEM